MNSLVTTTVGTTAVGLMGGLGYGVYNKHYGVGAYGSNLNDPYIGYSDFVIHGAALRSCCWSSFCRVALSSTSEKIRPSTCTNRTYVENAWCRVGDKL